MCRPKGYGCSVLINKVWNFWSGYIQDRENWEFREPGRTLLLNFSESNHHGQTTKDKFAEISMVQRCQILHPHTSVYVRLRISRNYTERLIKLVVH